MKRFFASLLLCAMLMALMPFALAEDAEKTENTPLGEGVRSECASSVQYAMTDAENKATSIAFADLSKTLNRYNYSMMVLSDAKHALDDNEDRVKGAIAQLTAVSDNYALVIDGLNDAEDAAELAQNAAMATIYHNLSSLWEVNASSLAEQIKSLESQKTTLRTTENTLDNSESQLIKGTESLYIAILTMENAVGDVQRGIDTLERMVKLTEKQREIGMASDYDVEGMKYQYESAKSQLDSLNYQIKTSKITLEGMLGMALNGTVKLGAITMPTEEELSAVDYEKKLSLVIWQNADCLNAEEEDDAGTGSDDAVRAARNTVAYQFKTICLNVPEKQRLMKVAEDAVTYQQRTFEIAAKKYEMGMLSHEEYLSAEGNLESAKSSLRGAELELFTAYRNYIWAIQGGIV